MDLAEQLTGRGWDVQVAALQPARSGVPLDVDVLGRSAGSPGTLRAIRRRGRQAGAVLAFGSTTLPAAACALAGTRTGFAYRSIGDPGHWLRGSAHRARTGAVMRRARAVAALWPGAADDISHLYRVPSARIHVIANHRRADWFVPPDADERTAARQALGLEGDAPVVLYLGALEAEKQLDVAISAVGRMPEARMLVAGSGSLAAELEARAARAAPGRVWFLGPVADPRPLLHATDVVVLTSRTEGQPGVAIEAGLCGVPVVATDVGGTSEIVVDGQTGYLVAVNDPAAVALALGRAVRDGRRLGAEARARCASRFSAESVVPRWEALISGCAADRHGVRHDQRHVSGHPGRDPGRDHLGSRRRILRHSRPPQRPEPAAGARRSCADRRRRSAGARAVREAADQAALSQTWSDEHRVGRSHLEARRLDQPNPGRRRLLVLDEAQHLRTVDRHLVPALDPSAACRPVPLSAPAHQPEVVEPLDPAETGERQQQPSVLAEHSTELIERPPPVRPRSARARRGR